MKRFAMMVLIAFLHTGCSVGPPFPEYETDPALRAKRFDSCMASLPAGPVATHYNDWAEVIGECDSVAYRQSQVCVKNCQLVTP